MKSLQFLLTGSVLLITTGSLCAQKTSQVVVTDHGTTAPVINSGDTGNTAGLDNRFGFDQKEIHGQTFTLEKGGTLKSIFIAYNGFDRGAGTATIGIDAGNNRKWDLVETVTLESVDFSGNSATDGRDTPVYWMKWDLSAFNLELPAGTSLFQIQMGAETSESWLFAPIYSSTNPYAGGRTVGVSAGSASNDAGFAVTLVPAEPQDIEITGFSRSGDTVSLTWTSSDTRSYLIKWSNDMTTWNNEAGEPVSGENGETTVSLNLADLGVEESDSLFFRVEEE